METQPGITAMTMSKQFYKMTLLEAISHYQQGDLTVKGLLHIYLKIKIGPGWQLRKSQKEICEELGISKSGFYTGLSKLKAEGSINWSTPATTQYCISLPGRVSNLENEECGQEFHDCGNESTIKESNSTIAESQSTIEESNSTIAESQSTIEENKTRKAVLSNGSSDSPDLYSDSYQIFLKSLSDCERENFLKFGLEESKRLPKPPTLPMKWIECNADELRAKWESFCGTSSNHQSSKFSVWANHPRFNELWQGVCTHGTTGYVVQNIRDTTIKEFCKFCYESPEITEEILSCLNSHQRQYKPLLNT
jgi:uncharacterized coiled-coil protein SlyX